jgi:hypothetical protein
MSARDYGQNWSPLSDSVTVTTAPLNPNDTMSPSIPTNLGEMHWNDGEIHLRWTQSTDDVDAQAHIRYDVDADGFLSDTLVGTSFSIVYNPGPDHLVLIEVAAVDTIGNESEPASIVIDMHQP